MFVLQNLKRRRSQPATLIIYNQRLRPLGARKMFSNKYFSSLNGVSYVFIDFSCEVDGTLPQNSIKPSKNLSEATL